MRSFEFARKVENGVVIADKAFPEAQLPEYQTKRSAGADFFCAEEVVIPSIWSMLFSSLGKIISKRSLMAAIKPTLVHTGVKAYMEEDEDLDLYNRSSNPGKFGLILANSVGIVDADYADNPDNDGEIMFAFFNIKPWDVTIKVGYRVGQGIFRKVLRPTKGLRVKDTDRQGGFGSTSK